MRRIYNFSKEVLGWVLFIGSIAVLNTIFPPSLFSFAVACSVIVIIFFVLPAFGEYHQKNIDTSERRHREIIDAIRDIGDK